MIWRSLPWFRFRLSMVIMSHIRSSTWASIGSAMKLLRAWAVVRVKRRAGSYLPPPSLSPAHQEVALAVHEAGGPLDDHLMQAAVTLAPDGRAVRQRHQARH